VNCDTLGLTILFSLRTNNQLTFARTFKLDLFTSEIPLFFLLGKIEPNNALVVRVDGE